MIGLIRRRAPEIAFGAVEVVAFVVWLAIGRSDWFYIDEWDFLAARKAGDVSDLFRPHNGHWTTLPVLAFRVLYSIYGLRTYAPYRMLAIVSYLVVVTLMLVVMRRAGVHPWIATSAATLLVFFGAGWENIILPFQITFTGSLAFGLVHLLLADRDGPFKPRDLFGLAAGLLGLMCSGVGIVMVAIVGAVVYARRGREVALLHVVPLAACYAAWLIAIGRSGSAVGRVTVGAVIGFVRTGVQTAFGALGPFAGFGVAFAILLVGGLVIAFRARRRSGQLTQLTPPVALFAGSLALILLTAVDRSVVGTNWARQSRYVSLVGVMTVPALAVAADAIAARWRLLLPVAIIVFLVGIPANVHAARHAQHAIEVRDATTRAFMLSLPLDPLASEVPRSVRPDPTTATEVTIGWLLDVRSQHRLPHLAITPRLLASDDFRLSFSRPDGPMPATNCVTSSRTVTLDLHRGDEVGVYDDTVNFAPAAPTLVGLAMQYPAANDAPIVALRDVGRVLVIPDHPGRARICTGSGG